MDLQTSMEKMTAIDCDDEFCDSASAVSELHGALRILTGKWKGEILWALSEGTQRFGELRRGIPGITQHMLTAQLRELEADGLVSRVAYSEVPPRVEYSLTEAALALRPVFEALFAWSSVHGPGRHRIDALEEAAE